MIQGNTMSESLICMLKELRDRLQAIHLAQSVELEHLSEAIALIGDCCDEVTSPKGSTDKPPKK